MGLRLHRLRRSLALFQCGLYAFALVGGAYHQAFEEHAICAEHGDWLHSTADLHDADDDAHDMHDGHAHHASLSVASQVLTFRPVSDSHESAYHCAVDRHFASSSMLGEAPQQSDALTFTCLTPTNNQAQPSAFGILARAPKTSPPVA